MRIKLTLSYDGTEFFGSQIQKATPKTVIGTLSSILQKLGIHSIPVASGRTDRGVHATAQVCHLDLPPFWSDIKKLKETLERMLPPSIAIRRIEVVSDDFHARYSAKRRIYRYIISTKKSSPFTSRYVTHLPDATFEKLRKKIGIFEGKHDFSYFQKTGSDVKTTTREIYKAFAYKHKSYIILYFEANGFLRSQVRLMCGALLKLKKEQIEEMLKKEKHYKIKPAPPQGLYLAKIKY
ncbi:tRNA pseudouridine synthase A [hydrothermal vent metagenome]|uniref:tRNA pseudouridine synthase A n=1 Tax=hydrothermal vent metagenome TaxID=652676 RepID=A0A1W1BPI0_9ZZZZ